MEDRDEFVKRLFTEEYERLINKAFRLSGDIYRAQDLVQETFLFAMIHYEELSDHPNPRGWLSTVLYNLSMNERRRWDNSRSVSLDQMGDIFPAEPVSTLTEILPKKLRNDERELLVLRFEQNLSYREIAETLGISEAAGRTKMSRLMKKIQKYFDIPK